MTSCFPDYVEIGKEKDYRKAASIYNVSAVKI